MKAVICDISALQYWRTPPALRDVEIPREAAIAPPPDGAGLDPRLFRPLTNARDADRAIGTRLLTDLKGIEPPVHVLAPLGSSHHDSALAIVHRTSSGAGAEDVVDLGGALCVLTPAATLLNLASRLSFVQLLLVVHEFAGIFAIHRETSLTRLVINALTADGTLSPDVYRAAPDHIRSYSNADGSPRSMTSRTGLPLPWELSFDRFGRPGSLWKRPPLLTPDELLQYALGHHGQKGATQLANVARRTIGGSASPLETRLVLLLSLGRRRGGEGLPLPCLNRRIELDSTSREISGLHFCVGDLVWEEQKLVIEVNGEAFHADKQGFKLQSNRTLALEHMGYQVFEITYGQMRNLQAFDAFLEVLAHRSRLKLANRTPAFLRQRKTLHGELFDRDGEIKKPRLLDGFRPPATKSPSVLDGSSQGALVAAKTR